MDNTKNINYVEKITQLQQLIPEAFQDGKLNIAELENLLNGYVSDNENNFLFTWHGKNKAKRGAYQATTLTLKPNRDKSKNFETTKNIFIEGDNLNALKVLRDSYANRVKMIYIDPPYNTGKDFIYSDNYEQPFEEYKRIIGLINDEGQAVSTSKDELKGRKHTGWLNMIYPRLLLARDFLKDDGVIFISIDDNEVTNLRKVCDEVFGENNFIAMLVHKNNSNKNQTTFVGVSTEYILVYTKNIDQLKISVGDSGWKIEKNGAKDVAQMFNKLKSQGLSLDEISDEIKTMYSRPKYSHLNRWNKVDNDGVFKDADLSRDNGPKDYTIINPYTGKEVVIPDRGWGKSYEELLSLQEKNMIWYGDENTPPGAKDYITEDSESVPDNFWYFDNSIDTKYLKKLFGKLVFDNPKPVNMIKQMISLNTSDDDIILDFFAGSATTAQAVMEQNMKDNQNRKFILVQLPENLNKSLASATGKSKTIIKNAIEYLNEKDMPLYLSEIGMERIRLSGELLIQENPDSSDKLDIGFKVFELSETNFPQWSENISEEDITQQLDILTSPITNAENAVYEIMLLLKDYLLDEKIEVVFPHTYAVGNEHVALIYLQEYLENDAYEWILINHEQFDSVIIYDNSLSQSQKINLKGTLKEKLETV